MNKSKILTKKYVDAVMNERYFLEHLSGIFIVHMKAAY